MRQKLISFRASLPAKLLMVVATSVAAAAFFSSCQIKRAPASKVEAAHVSNTLSASDRMEIFEFVWRTVNEKYYDPAFHGVDWAAVRERYRPRIEAAPNDQEFYAQFELMLAELRDDHTRFHAPPPAADVSEAADKSAARGTFGMKLAEVEGQTVVAEVEADSGAARAGIKPGMILQTVNGRPVEEIYRQIRAVFPGTSSERSMKSLMQTALLYGGFMPQPRRFGFINTDGKEFDAQPELTPATPPHVSARRLASGFGYIKFDNWIPPAAERFNEELAKLSDTHGLVIDLRGNGGGQADVLLKIAGNFFAAPTYYGGFRRRDGTLDRYSTHAPARLYKQPLVILVDERSASASESFTIFMQESGRAYVVGRQSNGATLNQTIQKVKGGGELRVSIRAYISPRGRNAEGTGVVPDKIVPLTIADLRLGRDATLEAAEAYLKGSLSKKL